LFVSHNMAAVRALCSESILLKFGQIQLIGPTEDILSTYLQRNIDLDTSLLKRTDREGNGKAIVSHVYFKDKDGKIIDSAMSGQPLTVEIGIKANDYIDFSKLIIGCSFSDPYQNQIVSWVTDEMNTSFYDGMAPNVFLNINNLNIRPGLYDFNVQLSFGSTSLNDITDIILTAAQLTVIDSDFYAKGKKIRPGYRALLDADFRIN